MTSGDRTRDRARDRTTHDLEADSRLAPDATDTRDAPLSASSSSPKGASKDCVYDMPLVLARVPRTDPDLDTSLEVEDDALDDSDMQHHIAVPGDAASIYPRVLRAQLVKHSFDAAADSATIDSSRTIYAEDIDYCWENGRRYCGDYAMPNDSVEQTRQYLLHQAYLKFFDLQLTTVPLHDPGYILDIGTGIGEWAIGMAEKYPDCEVFGTDIAAIQPTDQVPFNVEFQIEDAREEWIRTPDSFDLVHLRNIAGAFSDWSFVYQQAFACLKPDGYIEVIDYDDYLASENFTSWFPEGSPMDVLVTAVRQASTMDRRPTTAHLEPRLLVGAGFVDVRESRYDLPVGKLENRKSGDDWLLAFVMGIEATCLRPLTKYKGWDPAYVRELCDMASQDLVSLAEDPDRAKGLVVKLKVLVGRKPQAPGQWSAQALNENGEIGDGSGDESTVETMSACRSSPTAETGAGRTSPVL